MFSCTGVNFIRLQNAATWRSTRFLFFSSFKTQKLRKTKWTLTLLWQGIHYGKFSNYKHIIFLPNLWFCTNCNFQWGSIRHNTYSNAGRLNSIKAKSAQNNVIFLVLQRCLCLSNYSSHKQLICWFVLVSDTPTSQGWPQNWVQNSGWSFQQKLKISFPVQAVIKK